MTSDEEKAKILGETAQIAWQEIQPWFAKGAVIYVAETLDLVEVAHALSQDDKARVSAWMAEGTLGQVSDAQAVAWHEANQPLWAVVVRPWILVQNPQQTV